MTRPTSPLEWSGIGVVLPVFLVVIAPALGGRFPRGRALLAAYLACAAAFTALVAQDVVDQDWVWGAPRAIIAAAFLAGGTHTCLHPVRPRTQARPANGF